MNVDEEKQIAKTFFSTEIGKKVKDILAEYKTQSRKIIELNARVKQLEESLNNQNKEIPLSDIDQRETNELIDKAISLMHSPKRPEYLFSIKDAQGNLRGVYTSDFEEMLKKSVETETMEEEYYG